LVIVDGDTPEVRAAVEEHLAKTLTVETGRGNKQYYFICGDLDKPIRLAKTGAKTIGDIGDVLSHGKQGVGPGSLHPNGKRYQVVEDLPIIEVRAAQIRFALRDFIKNDSEATASQTREQAKKNSASIDDLRIEDVVDLSGLTRREGEYQGSHPVHGSDGGQNFTVNPAKNVWHCFRCSSGGGPLDWIAVRERIIDCSECVPGALRGEKFKEVLKVACEKYGLKGERPRVQGGDVGGTAEVEAAKKAFTESPTQKSALDWLRAVALLAAENDLTSRREALDTIHNLLHIPKKDVEKTLNAIARAARAEREEKALNAMVKAAKTGRQAKAEGQEPNPVGDLKKDYGHAAVLAQYFTNKFHWAAHRGTWLRWTGQVWQIVAEEVVTRIASETLRKAYTEELSDVTDEVEFVNLMKKILESCIYQRVKAALSFLSGWNDIHVREATDWDKDPWLLNVANGTIDLRTGALSPHDPGDLITKLAPVAYNPAAKAPLWDAFLERVLPDEETRKLAQRVIGYSMTGDVSERVLFFLYGPGANGKTTFLEANYAMLGDYAQRIDPETLMVHRDTNIPNDIAALQGVRFVPTVEVEEGKRLAEVLVKQLTGTDTLRARLLYHEYFDYHPCFHIWLAANHYPVIKGTDRAIWDRIRLIPFVVTIPLAERDRKLQGKLKEELPGILRWALEGCLEWEKGGLETPRAVMAATEAYRAEMDILAAFIADCCVESPQAAVTVKDHFDNYLHWCEKNGEKPLSKLVFGKRMKDRGFVQDQAKGGNRARYWKGIGPRDQRQWFVDEQDSKTGTGQDSKAENGLDSEVETGQISEVGTSGTTLRVSPHEAASMQTYPRFCSTCSKKETGGTSEPCQSLSSGAGSGEEICPHFKDEGHPPEIAQNFGNSEDQESRILRIKKRVEEGCSLPELQDAFPEEEGTIARLRMDGRIGESPTNGRLYWDETWRMRG
jgi:putative DNA primase/helicase